MNNERESECEARVARELRAWRMRERDVATGTSSLRLLITTSSAINIYNRALLRAPETPGKTN
jgi:hypothetical protein